MFTKNLTLFVLLCILASYLFIGSSMAQDKKLCLFISEAAGPWPQDEPLYEWLSEQYEVDIAIGDDIKAEVYDLEDFDVYDFIFVSESISSSDVRPLKGAPRPMFFTELWSSQTSVMGWTAEAVSPDFYGTAKSEGDNMVTIIDGSHPLAAGFATDSEVMIVSGSDNATEYLTYVVPQIEHIPIAALSNDEDRIVVLGIEEGTSLYTDVQVNDGSLVSQNRCAAVGIHANAFAYITDDAYKLMDAGIKWILKEDVGVEQTSSSNPGDFYLAQNFPNPFNPSTEISFTLKKAGFTTLTVYNTVVSRIYNSNSLQYRWTRDRDTRE